VASEPTLLVTVDVEHWYDSRLFNPEKAVTHEASKSFTDPEEDLGTTVDCLKKHGIKATFFILGSLFEEHPKIAHAAHPQENEVALHAYRHRELYTKAEFQDDLKRGIEAFRKNVRVSPRGYRHPYFMVNQWKLDVLSEHFDYDASLVPSIHIPGHYGSLRGPRKPVRHREMVELPLSVAPYLRLPAATGWYYRNLGEKYIRWILSSSLKAHGYAQVCLHTWEFSPKPRLSGVPWHVFKNCGKPMEKLIENICLIRDQLGAHTTTCIEYIHKL
jgi:hypothetical protein